MALSQLYSALAGDVITAARWNNEFGNIYANGTDVAFPLTKAVSFAGFTITVDVAGVSTINSPSNSGFVFTVGSKSGVPSVNGSLGVFTASTFTDTDTANSGTAALWTGLSLRTPTLAASNTSVTTTDAATLYIESGPAAGTNQTLTNSWALQTGGNVKVAKTDARTTTVAAPLTVEAVTTGSPAAGIGTGVVFQAESADESPSNFGQLEFAANDIGAGSEDTYFQILTRTAGAALTACWRFFTTTAFRGIITHANTADRTYVFPNESTTVIGTTDTATLTNKTLSGAVISGAGPASPIANTLYSDNLIKGWGHLTGAGAFTLTDDFNVSSITANAAGDFTINWATAFANDTYAITAMERGSLASDALVCIENTKSSTAVNIYVKLGATRTNPSQGVCFIAVGD